MRKITLLLLVLFALFTFSKKTFAQVGSTCGDPNVIASLPYNQNGMTTDGFGDDYDETDKCSSNYMKGNDYVFSYTPPFDKSISITLTNTSTLVGLFVLDGCPDDPLANCVEMVEAAGGNPQIPEVALTGSITYYIIVDRNSTIQPSTDFDINITELTSKDIGVTVISSPVSWCGLTSAETVTVTVENFGETTVNNFDVSYTIDGGAPVTENVTSTLSPGATLDYSFTATADLSGLTSYDFEAYTTLAGDADPGNDNTLTTITHTAGVSAFPYNNDFEGGPGSWVFGGTGSSWAMGTPAATTINSAASGSNAWVTNLTGNHNASENSWIKSPCFDFSSITNPVVDFNLWHETGLGGTVYIEYTIDGGANWTEIDNWTGSSGGWINFKELQAGLASESGVIFRIRFEDVVVGTDEGVAVDDFHVYEAPVNDLGVTAITSPEDGCNLGATETVSIDIFNFGLAAQSGFNVAYSVDGGGPIIELVSGTVNPGSTLSFEFATKADLSGAGPHTITAETQLAGDQDNTNNEHNIAVFNYPVISAFPFSDDFEGSSGFFNPGGTNSSWAYGTPAAPAINAAASGTKAWVTNLTGDYNAEEDAWAESPCFDFSLLTEPAIDVNVWYETGLLGNAKLQYSTDGSTWNDIDTWIGSGGTWENFVYDISSLAGEASVKFRFKLTAGFSGTDEGLAFDDFQIYDAPADDLGVINISAPESGCSLTATEDISVQIFNFGIAPQASFDITYTINGGAPVTEIVGSTVNPGGTLDYTFTTKADLTAAGEYIIEVFTELGGDADLTNDTSIVNVFSFPVISAFPVNQSFEGSSGNWYPGGSEVSWEYGTPAATKINAAASGIKAWVTNLTGDYTADEDSWLESPCYDFSALIQPSLDVNVWYETGILGNAKVQYTTDEISWIDIDTWNGSNGAWENFVYDISSLAGEASVKFRFTMKAGFSGTDEGLAFDDFQIYDAPANDLGVISSSAPVSGCSLSSTEDVTVQIFNFGIATQSNFNITYSINGGIPVTEMVTSVVSPGGTLDYTFTTKADIAAPGEYIIEVYTELGGDADNTNDTSIMNVYSFPFLSGFPYNESFEGNGGDWYPMGTKISWQYGEPSASVINTAASGTKAWVTNLTGDYMVGEDSWLESPCFNFTTLVAPSLNINVWYETGVLGNAKIEYTTDGVSWTTLETLNGSSGAWENKVYDISSLNGEPYVKFRMTMKAGISGTNEGIAVDDVQIYDPPADDLGITAVTAPETGCSLTATEDVTAEIFNFGIAPQSGFDITYIINGGAPITETVSSTVLPGGTLSYTFTQKADLSAPNIYLIEVFTELTGDEDNTNDTTIISVTSYPFITTFPYEQDFEAGKGGWFEAGDDITWQLGTPAGSVINSAFSNTNAWVTNLSGDYNSSEQSWVESPCFDFSGLVIPHIQFAGWPELNIGSTVYFEYSTDDGSTWDELENWTGNSGAWIENEYFEASLGGEVNVKFRITLDGGMLVDEGFAFDYIRISESPLKDLGVTAINAPVSDCGLTATEDITIDIFNFGVQAQTGFDVAYSINGGGWVTENISSTIDPDVTLPYTFTAKADLSANGAYTIRAVTLLTGDEDNLNDTMTVQVFNFPTISAFPYSEDFEVDNGGWYSGGELNSWELGVPDGGQTINAASSGTNCWVTNLDGDHNLNEESYVESPCFDLSGMLLPHIRFDLWVASGMLSTTTFQYSTDGGSSWTDLDDWNGNSGGWNFAEYYEGSLAGEADVKFRFAFDGSSVSATEGFAFDLFTLEESPLKNLGVVNITAPVSGCELTASETVTITIENFGLQAQSGYDVGFSVDGGAYTIENISATIAPGATYDYTFTATADLSTMQEYEFAAATFLTGDEDETNDTLIVPVGNSPLISTFPYIQDFEAGQAGWYTRGQHISWALGTPAATAINSAYSGSNSWVTNLTGNCNPNEDSWVESPCFDVSSLVLPVVEFGTWIEMGLSSTASIEYSTDGGSSWTEIDHGPSSTGGWSEAQWSVPGIISETNVKFRLHFVAGGFLTNEGFAFDLFSVHESNLADLGMEGYISPQGGCDLSATEDVTVNITNYGLQAQSDFDVVYELDGGAPVTENITVTINPEETMVYTFSAKADLSGYGMHFLKVYTNLTGDEDNSNDTTYILASNAPVINTFPYTEDFEFGPGNWMSFGENPSWQAGTPSATIINSAYSGNICWVTNLTGDYNENENSYVISPCFDFSGITAPVLDVAVWHELGVGAVTKLEFTTDGGSSWVEFDSWTGNSGGWDEVQHILTDLMGESNVRFRFTLNASGILNEGFAFDAFTITGYPAADIGITEISAPETGCELSSTETVSVKITNFGLDPQNNFNVAYSLDGGSSWTTEVVLNTVTPGGTLSYDFTAPADFSAYDTYMFAVTTDLSGDENTDNDTLYK
ncbi:MAG: hypothetical protein KJ607_00220, partial [Bacteroidetes bacterium]|nr:hypothetical protein [Bacteroidota bacterium]